MIIEKVKLSQEFNFNGNKTWIGLEASLEAGEDFVEAVKKSNEFILNSFEMAVKGVKEIELSDEQVLERSQLISDLNDATELKQITIIHNEASQWMKSDKIFLDAVLENKLRLTVKKDSNG